MEFPHDAVPASRSDDNRRADGGLPDFQQFKISCLLKIFGTMADVREALCLFRVFRGLKFSYYYRSFSCFSEKIFSKAWSFHMMRFPPREATTTAEQTEAFQIFSNSRYHVCSKSSAPWPTSARHSVSSVYSVD